MNQSMEKLLRDRYVDGVYHTHVSLVQPRGKFLFNRQEIEELWDIYCEKIKDKDTILGIAEKPNHYLPVLVDVDIKLKKDEKNKSVHLYTEEHVKKVIEIYQSILRNIVEDCTDDNLLCVLLEKPIYYIMAGDITYAKNGFHLHFPNLFLSKIDQGVHLIPRVQEMIQKMEVFSELGIENSADVIDKSCCKVPWLLYGSRKSENMESYKVSKVFTSEGDEIKLEDAFYNYDIYDQQENRINIHGNVEKYLPRILSIFPYGRQTQEIKQGLVSPLKEKLQQEKKEHKKTNIKISSQEQLKTAEKLLPMLADFRTEDRNEWMTIGWALFNIGDGCTQAMELWMDFSSRCEDKYDEAKCIYEWERMIKKEITIKTLHHFANIDSPELYKEFNQEHSQYYVKESLNGSHNDIAKILYAIEGNSFVCASITNKMWFQFRDHRWEEIEGGIFLREKISSEIVTKFTDMGKEVFNKLATVQDKAEEAMYNARIKQIQKMICNLKSSPFKNNVMNEAMEVFYDRRFQQKLDQNPWLIGFKNGLYDLKENIFRDGSPEDFISKVLPNDYKDYKMTDEDVQNVVNFLLKVFPDEEIRNYFLDTYSDIFVGGNNQKKIYLWTGDGDNGKSITQMFFDEMLGELAIKFNTQYFTGKKVASGSANPELARAAPPVRSATMEEPDADEQLNIGELKKLSGGDKFWARDLFEKGKKTREVTPMFMITLICNKLPKIKYADKATWNRLRVIPYESIFVEPGEPCPETLEEQIKQKRFPMDKDLKHKIPGMVGAFTWYLLEWRKNINVRKEPEKVREATAMYRRQNDIYRQFIEESIAEDENTTLTLIELYAQFKEWFKEGWPNMTLPIKNEVKEYFERLWGVCNRVSKWKGYRIRTLQDDVDSGDVIILDQDDLVNYETEGKALPPM